MGEGFGGYWKIYIPELGQELDVSPHSLYVQTLVKTGVIGLGLYLVLVWKSLKQMFDWMKIQDYVLHPEYALVLVGIITILQGIVILLLMRLIIIRCFMQDWDLR